MQKKPVGVRHGAFEVLDERLRGDGLWGIESPPACGARHEAGLV